MDLGDKHPALLVLVVIGKVVEKLRFYLVNSSDSKYESTIKKLDLLEDKLRFLHQDNLRRVNPDKEEAVAAWLQNLGKATYRAEELVGDIEAEVSESANSDVMTWLRSDSGNLLRMKYTIGKLASVCAEGESFISVPNMNEDSMKGLNNEDASAMRIKTKPLHDDAVLIGRDKEIAMILDMVLGDARYEAATSLEDRAHADELQISKISQKRCIIEALRNTDLSEERQKVAESVPCQKEMAKKVEYTHVAVDGTTNQKRNPTVIPIVGISGVGKTTLAQFIFNNERVQEHFKDCSAWVYMTDKIKEEQMIKQILYSFQHLYTLGCGWSRGIDNIYDTLEGLIKGKRFFLVIDDVWAEVRTIWGRLRSVLSKGAPGSVVLITTQLYGEASFLGTTIPIVLDPLQHDEFWALLKNYAFVDAFNSQHTEALKPIGKDVADKLYGLPLAAKAIGASLRSSLDKAHWERLLKSWWWNISDNSLGNNVIPCLGISYCELPGYLRQCFVYFSIFPRNYLFEKNKLIQMWIASGFVQVNHITCARRLEDIASEWFDELVSRAFLQPTVWKTLYIMHDLFRYFAIALSSGEYCVIDKESGNVSKIVRHLYIDADFWGVPSTDFKIEQLWSSMIFGISDPKMAIKTVPIVQTILKSSRSLRMLSLDSIEGSAAMTQLGNQHDQVICMPFVSFSNTLMLPSCVISDDGLTYLRYLDLSFSGINILPDWLCSLCNLQVLGLRGCKFTELPKNINSLINLRHLNANGDTIALCYGIGKLTKLQELHEFCVKEEDGHRITELRSLNSIIGSLCILNLQRVIDKEEALQANLCHKDYLTSLDLRWDWGEPAIYRVAQVVSQRQSVKGKEEALETDLFSKGYLSSHLLTGKASQSERTPTPNLAMDILGGLSPPRNLQELKIVGCPDVAFPDWVGQLKYVRAVYISFCRELHVLPPLGQLEHLQKLRLHYLPSIVNVNSEVYGTSNIVFQSLEELHLSIMPNWDSWEYAGGREFIPNLKKLRITQCSNLRKVPFMSLGSAIEVLSISNCGSYASMISMYLRRLTGLTRLQIYNCSDDLIVPCQQLKSLEYLHFARCYRLLFEGGLWYLRNLKYLKISGCSRINAAIDKELAHEEEQVHVMHSLIYLRIDDSFQSMNLNNSHGKLATLRILHLYHYKNPGFSDFEEQWFEQITSLQELKFSYCTQLRHLPTNLAALSSLMKLTLDSCSGIHSLPLNGLPANLKELQIINCSPILEVRCQHKNEYTWLNKAILKIWWSSKRGSVWQETKKHLRKVRRGWEELLKNEKVVLPKNAEREWLKNAKDVLMKNAKEVLNNAKEKRLENAEEEEDWLKNEEEEWLKNEEEEELWLKNKEKEWLKNWGEDWPKIAHVPYIRVNFKIVQNLYV